MKVQLAKLKADQEKAGKKGDHRVSRPPPLPPAKGRNLTVQENFKTVAAMWKDAPENPVSHRVSPLCARAVRNGADESRRTRPLRLTG